MLSSCIPGGMGTAMRNLSVQVDKNHNYVMIHQVSHEVVNQFILSTFPWDNPMIAPVELEQ